MTKSSAKSPAVKTNRLDLDSWLFSTSELQTDAVTLLTAYREAAESAREASDARNRPAAEAPTVDATEPPAEEAAETASRGLPAVPRLRAVDGLEATSLASLHGQLLAGGHLTAEVLGRSDGLAYRITRDGLRHLNGEAAIAEAA